MPRSAARARLDDRASCRRLRCLLFEKFSPIVAAAHPRCRTADGNLFLFSAVQHHSGNLKSSFLSLHTHLKLYTKHQQHSPLAFRPQRRRSQASWTIAPPYHLVHFFFPSPNKPALELFTQKPSTHVESCYLASSRISVFWTLAVDFFLLGKPPTSCRDATYGSATKSQRLF